MILKKTICLLICVLFVISLIPGITGEMVTQPGRGVDLQVDDISFNSAYTSQTPVDINNDTALISFSSSGAGTSGNPLILGGWNITVDANQNAIDITGTTMYFEIRNCWIDIQGYTGTGIHIEGIPSNSCIIEDVTIQNAIVGVDILSVDYTDVINCNVSNCETGLQFYQSHYCTLQKYTSSYCDYGVNLYDADYLKVVDANCTMNKLYGLFHSYSTTVEFYNSTFSFTSPGWAIKGDHSSFMVLYNCTLEGNEGGAMLGDTCGYANFTKNWFLNNSIGISYVASTALILRNNTFANQTTSAFSITDCDASVVANNTIKDNGLGFTINDCSAAVCANNTISNDGLRLFHDSIALYDTYIIENNTVNGRPLVYMIHKVDTTAPSNAGQLIMINCTNVNATSLDCSKTTTGIMLDYCNYINITDSVMRDVDYIGVSCRSSSYCTFRNITSINQGGFGMLFSVGDHNLVDQCEIRNCAIAGIALNTISLSTISNGTIDNCKYAFTYGASSDISFYNNTISNGYYPAFIFTNWYNFSIVKNHFINDGINFGLSDLATNLKIAANITENTVNGKPLEIYTHLRGGEISGTHGAIFLFNCTDVEISNQNCSYTVFGILAKDSTNISISNSQFSNNKNGGILLHTAAYSRINGTICNSNLFGNIIVETAFGLEILDNQISNGILSRGIDIDSCPYATIKGNDVSNCSGEGIFVENSDYIDVFGNLADLCNRGIYILSCSSSTIYNNVVQDNSIGIESTAIENALVTQNEIHYNTLDGIFHHDSPSAAGNLFTSNHLTNNGRHGFNLSQTVAPMIAYNILIDNIGYGVFANDTVDGRIYHNYFIDNNGGLIQGYDESSTTTTWYDAPTAEGNYWSDYDHSGTYVVDGPATSSDLYPLVAPDSDSDGLSDVWEILNGLDPFSSDSDGDLMPDNFEVDYGLNPLADDSGDDLDSDSLTNLEEYQLGLRPDNSDSDSDSIPDAFEVDNGLNPLYDDSRLDADSDGLSNLVEYQIGTDVNDEDSDADTIPDLYEVSNGLDPLTNDSALDFDNDSLSNLEEYDLGTSANNSDSDFDSMPDAYEVANSLDPTMNDAGLDLDGDGLSNLDEMLSGTRPDAVDSDGDMIDDYFEVTYGLNPLASDSSNDLDNDNLTNYQEYLLGLNPNSMDSDGDLMPDAWEVENYLNPLYDDANLDPDGDGISNYEEYLAGSNPWSADMIAAGIDVVPLLIGVGAFISGMAVLYIILHIKGRNSNGG